jgi:glycosyltransferase involved in cell wall biosynthesis
MPSGTPLAFTDVDAKVKNLRIAQVAPPFESVPPTGYGGTERVISVLTEELVRRGHSVTLFASGDSRTAAQLVPIVERALWHQKLVYRDFTPFWSVALGRLVIDMGEFDLIHSHLDYFGFPLARIAPCPVVTTLHGRLDQPELQPLSRAFNDVPLVSISDAQRRPAPDANWVDTIYHGIDLDAFSLNTKGGDYLAFLGRISPEKGLDAAVRVARAAGMPLKIAARKPLPFKHDPDVRRDWDYYQRDIRPLLAGRDVEFIGEVGGRDKDECLGNAAALLFPIRWPEPFGLVMVEALACGTPVLALRDGSVPEVLEDGKTGFICDSEDDLLAATRRIATLDRRQCRAEVERRFSPDAMAQSYEHLYRKLIGGGISKGRPQAPL